MSLLFSHRPPLFHPKYLSLHPQRPHFFKPQHPLVVKSLSKESSQDPCHVASPEKPRWEQVLSTLASLYPVYVTVGGAIACVNPSAFEWFVKRGPVSYSFSLGLIMLAMGVTLELKELVAIFKEKPLSILSGCVAQFIIMPAFGTLVSKALGLPPSFSVGLILLGCCPGGTASNVVTLIAQGDVPLSVVMTVCSTLGAVLLTPLLTMILAGAYVPVDAVGLSISTLQSVEKAVKQPAAAEPLEQKYMVREFSLGVALVVVAPILLGSYIQSTFPSVVRAVIPFAPLLAVLTSSLLASSVFSENFVRLKSSVMSSASASGDIKAVLLAVVLLHFAGFLVGYIFALLCGFKEKQRRAISIEVGMQNSSLGVVLATSHFSSPLVALPPALSAVVMNVMGSSLGFVWRYISPSDHNQQSKSHD